jgi:hypothetical protein
MKDPANFSLLGHQAAPGDAAQGYSRSVQQSVGLRSIDNAFAKVYFDFGVLALLLYLAMGVYVFRGTVAGVLAVSDRAWFAVFAGCFVTMTTVDLITQFADFFWIGMGILGAIAQTTRAGADEATRTVVAADAR